MGGEALYGYPGDGINGLGVCMATSGPGAIHLLNGLYDASSTINRWWPSSASRRAPGSAAATSRR
ncbi:MAG TPA: hypothetical protein VG275_01145 [Solirubrobacteraceae bacterium]|nr:hypothetical protein [Solirubrobacteraceae bacterium]